MAEIQGEQRRERAIFETERHLVVGDVTLPHEGYQSRFSDLLNRGDLAFIAVTNAEITTIASGDVVRREFIVLGKSHIQTAYPADSGPGLGE